MARYLTPTKVSLLVLCTLYCSSVVPTSSTVPFLSFVVSSLQITTRLDDSSSTLTGTGPEETVRRIAQVLDKHNSSIPGRTLYDLFLAKLWAIDSLHALHEFFEGLESLLAKTAAEARRDAESGVGAEPSEIRLSRTSPMGVFVRRCQLEFTRLQFHDAMKLWTAFLHDKQLTAAAWRQRGHPISAADFDANLGDFDNEQAASLLETTYADFANTQEDSHHSVDDVERLLQFQVEKLQKYGNRVPREMMNQVQGMLSTSGIAPNLAYFVRFFEAWRAGDYTSAFDHLHRYFDYTMQSRDKTYYQYALLHMAILQADFGCFDEAMASMMETIATARENQDMHCLNFSLTWLSHLRKAHPEARNIKGTSVFGSEKQALAFLKTKAKEGKMWSLLGSVLLGETKLELSQGGNIVRAFEYLYQSAYLSTMHQVENNQGILLLMHSALFSRLGLDHISVSYARLLLHPRHSSIPAEDYLRAVCRVAYASAQRGKYDDALTTLSSIDPETLRVLKLRQHVTSYIGFVKVKRCLRRNDTIAAAHLLRALNDNSVTDPELEFTLKSLAIEQHILDASYETAMSMADALLDSLREQNADIYSITSTQLLKVRILSQCGQSHRGLSLSMRAAAVAYRSRVMPLLWDAIGAIAEILNEGSEFGAALQLLQAVIPQAIEGGDIWQCANLCATEADAWVGTAGAHAAASAKHDQAKALSRAERSLDRALQYYMQVEDSQGQGQTVTKKAMLAVLRGETDVADELAARFVADRAFEMERLVL